MFQVHNPTIAGAAATVSGAVLLAAVMTACSTTSTTGAPPIFDPAAAPTHSNDEATTQVIRLFEGVKKKDRADLAKFLAPNFELQRTSGEAVDRAAYLATLPNLNSYQLSAVTGSQYSDTLTATYSASTELIVDGRMFPSTPNPFLSTFVRTNGEWHLVSHGNFAMPK